MAAPRPIGSALPENAVRPTQNRAPRTVGVTVHCDVLSTNCVALRDRILAEMRRHTAADDTWTLFELDFVDTQMIDSMGLNLIISVFRTVTAEERKLRVLVHTDHLFRIMQFTRLTTQFEVVRA